MFASRTRGVLTKLDIECGLSTVRSVAVND